MGPSGSIVGSGEDGVSRPSMTRLATSTDLARERPTHRGAAVRSVFDHAAGRAAPMLLTSFLSFSATVDVLRLPTDGAPVRLGLVILAAAVGVGLTGILERPGPKPYWQMVLGTSLILMPVVSLQAFASRVPFVALSRGSAGPLLWLTLAALITLIGMWLFAVYQPDQAPQDASLLFLPAALLVPSILGAPGTLGETSALMTLGLANLVAGIAVFLCLLGPERWRPIGGSVALGGQFLVLWALGRGPVLGDGGGTVVPVCAAALLAATAILTVLAPLGALFSRRFVQTVEEQTRGTRPVSVPAKGTRRIDKA